MNRTKVEVRNPELFKEFVLRHTEGTSTNKYALWKGMITEDFLRIAILEFYNNPGRPRIIGRFATLEDNRCVLHLGLYLNKNAHVVSIIWFSVLFISGVFTLNLNVIIGAFVTSLIFYPPFLLLFYAERDASLEVLRLIEQLAKCSSEEEMKKACEVYDQTNRSSTSIT